MTKDSVRVWHRKFGHLSYSGQKTLQQKNMVHGLPQIKPFTKMCKECMIGKQPRDHFPKKSTWRASQVFQLVHADMWTN